MVNLTPYLLFDGNCADAMTFYQSCLGGELNLTRVGDSPMKFDYPPEYQQKILYSYPKSGAIEFSAADWLHPVRIPKQRNMVCLFINGGSYSELKKIFR